MRLLRPSVLVALLASFVSPAPARAAGTMFQVDSAKSKIQYTVIHVLHTVEGVSKQAVGKVVLQPDGTVLVQVVAPVKSFLTGSSGRDEHMLETMEESKYPNVVLKGRTTLPPATAYPFQAKLTVDSELDFHGRKKKESIPVEVTLSSPTEAHVTSTFSISLDKYEVDRPALALVKIHDDCKIDLDLALKQ